MLIDTKKMSMAFAATPLCQHQWTVADVHGVEPTKLCAFSALVAFAGVEPALIARMQQRLGADGWVTSFGEPVLRAEYGIGPQLARELIALFDREENEWNGVVRVLARCEQENETIRARRLAGAEQTRRLAHTPLGYASGSPTGSTTWFPEVVGLLADGTVDSAWLDTTSVHQLGPVGPSGLPILPPSPFALIATATPAPAATKAVKATTKGQQLVKQLQAWARITPTGPPAGSPGTTP